MASEDRGREDRDPAPDDHVKADRDRDLAAPNGATAIERHSRLLLRIYPAEYRRERGDEIIGTLLEATPAEHAWPRLRDARALAIGGLKARAAQNRHLTTAANLRVAVMVGVALFLSVWVGNYLGSVLRDLASRQPDSDWSGLPGVLTGLLVAATVLLAWMAPRIVALTGALATAAAVLYFVLARAHLVGPAVTQVACLAVLVALASPAARPSRRWLWLLGLLTAMALLPSLGFAQGLLGYVERRTPTAVMLAIGIVSIVWIGIDARLMVAATTALALAVVEADVQNVTFGVGLGQALGSLPFLLVIAAIAALAIWLLRRQSARTVA
jgi:hypothetical protein